LEGGLPSGTRVVACTGAATTAPIGVPARVDAAIADSVVPEDEDAGYYISDMEESEAGACGDASMADNDDENVDAAREDPGADSDDEDSRRYILLGEKTRDRMLWYPGRSLYTDGGGTRVLCPPTAKESCSTPQMK